jgi:hypothetical protein
VGNRSIFVTEIVVVKSFATRVTPRSLFWRSFRRLHYRMTVSMVDLVAAGVSVDTEPSRGVAVSEVSRRSRAMLRT